MIFHVPKPLAHILEKAVGLQVPIWSHEHSECGRWWPSQGARHFGYFFWMGKVPSHPSTSSWWGQCDLRRGNFRKCKGSLQALDSWIPDAALDPHGRGGWKAPAVRGPFTRWNQLPLQVILQAGRGSPGGLWLMDDPEVFGDGESEGPQRAAFHRPFPTII